MTHSPLPPPTKEGKAIIAAWTTTDQSLMINAYAGTGKTTALRQLAPHIKESRVLALAFNKKNAKDLEQVMPATFTCSTLNSQGHKALQKAHSKRLMLEESKNTKIIKSLAEDWGLGRLNEEQFFTFSNLLRLVKSTGLVPTTHKPFQNYKTLVSDDKEGWESIFDAAGLPFEQDTLLFVRAAAIKNIERAVSLGEIDYDDQIYISTLVMGIYERFPVVMVDEAQDLSPLNHLQIKKCLALNGRFIVVGDPKQAIYAFRGASSKSMPEIENLLPPGRFIQLSLSLTFRCSKLVVARNVSHAPGFTAAPNNLPGRLLDFRQKESWGLDDVPSPNFAILCRNNAPLLSAAFRIIKAGRGVSMLGRDIGKTLVVLAKKVCGQNLDKPAVECIEAINKWLDKERSLLIANGKEGQIAGLEDRAYCLIAIAEGVGGTLGKMIDQTIALFETNGNSIILGSGHRSKGLEWSTVIHLDPWRIPSKYAKEEEELGNPAPMEQENNLRYVIETRCKDLFILANVKGFEL